MVGKLLEMKSTNSYDDDKLRGVCDALVKHIKHAGVNLVSSKEKHTKTNDRTTYTFTLMYLGEQFTYSVKYKGGPIVIGSLNHVDLYGNLMRFIIKSKELIRQQIVEDSLILGSMYK